MAITDVTAAVGISTLAKDAVYPIKPSSGEWIVKNIVWEIPTGGVIEVRKTNGTLVARFKSDNKNGGLIGVSLSITSALWYEVKNISATAITVTVSYDGIISK